MPEPLTISAIALGVIPNAVWDSVKGAFALAAKQGSVNHDLEKCVLDARALAARALIKHFDSVSQSDDAVAQRELDRLHKDSLKAESVDLNRLALEFLNNDLAEFTKIVEDFTRRPDGITDEAWKIAVPNLASTWFFGIGDLIKQPHHEKAFKAFVREMLFRLQKQQNLPAQLPPDIGDQIAKALQDSESFAKGIPTVPDEIKTQYEQIALELTDIKSLVQKIERSTSISLDLRRPAPSLSDELASAKSARRLVFSERLVSDFVGPSNGLDWLLEFANCDENFAWTIVYGEGGMGKSRLALQLIQELTPDWVGGFLHGGFPLDQAGRFKRTEFQRWTPDHPTIFIIDYAACHSRGAAEAMQYFAEIQDKLEYKLRVVFLERYYATGTSYVRDLMGPNGAASTRYKSLNRETEFALRQWELDDFVELYAKALTALIGSAPNDVHLQAARALFSSDEFTKKRRLRPLYAGLCALRYSQDQEADISNWRADDIEDYVLNHEVEIWRDQVRAHDADVHMAMLSTVAGGIDANTFDDRAKAAGFPTFGANLPQCKLVVNHSEGGDYCLRPIEPDPVGEMFVRRRLRGDLFDHNQGNEMVAMNARRVFQWVLNEIEVKP